VLIELGGQHLNLEESLYALQHKALVVMLRGDEIYVYYFE